MARLFKKKVEKKKSLWRRAVDLALTDVRVAVGGMDHESLETLEELGLRGAETWKENGGETLELIPAPNASDTWTRAVIEIARESSRWLEPAVGK